jgi:signal transduction histidine kinase
MQSTLTSRVTWVLVAATVAMVGIILAIEVLFHATREVQEQEQRFQILTRQTSKVLMLAMSNRPHASMDEILDAIVDEEGVDRIRVISRAGKVLHSTHPDEKGKGLSGSKSLFDTGVGLRFGHEQTDQGERLVLREAIEVKQQCVNCHQSSEIDSVLEMHLVGSPALDGYQAERLMLLSIVLLQLLVFGTLWLVLRRLLIRPTRALLESMRRVTAGDLSERITLASPREFGQLGEQFNAMVAELQAARRQIESYYASSMERAERLATVGELTTTLSHEIKNPLAGLSSALQVLRKDPRLGFHGDILAEMSATVERLAKTTHDLLDFGREPSPSLAAHDANECVRSVLFFVRQQAGNECIQVIEELACGLESIWVDSQQLQQVLLNVCLNAVHAMPQGGTLTARTSRVNGGDSPQVRITVEDTGAGMSSKDLSRVFEPFFTTRSRGTGLGLTISRRLIEALGGSIAIESRLGHGTKVRVSVPVAGSGEANGGPA